MSEKRKKIHRTADHVSQDAPKQKTVIENPTIKLLELFDAVNEESRKEKKAVPAINKMIYYWTRKPLIVGKAIALASTLTKIDDVKNLLGITEGTRAYTIRADKEKYKELLGRDPKEIKVLDPFAGTGNLIFPAVELGLDVTASDYNPLAHLIQRGVLEMPAQYKGNLANDFESAANSIIEEVKKEIGSFYLPNQLAYLWLWCIRCPYCSQRTPLTNQMWIAKTSKVKIGMRFNLTDDKNFTVELKSNMSEEEGKKYTQRHGKAICISCENTIGYDIMTQDIAKNKDREIVAIQVRHDKKRDFVLPTKDDVKRYKDSVKFFEKNRPKFELQIPDEEIKPSHRKVPNVNYYGIYLWREQYSDRQLLMLGTLASKIKEYAQKDTKNTQTTRLYLCFLLAKIINMSPYGVIWSPSGIEPEHALTMRSPSVVFNHAEINPFEKVRGSLQNSTKNITDSIKLAGRLQNTARCKLQSVIESSTQKYDLIITDPPYGDDVQYGELSEFFYLWIYRILKDHIKLPSRPPLAEDFCEPWGRFGDKKTASEFFEKGLIASFKAMNKKLKDDGLMAVFFAHSTTKAWNQLLSAIRQGKFRVVASYALHTESKDNPLAAGKTSFLTSTVVVCKKIQKESSAFFEDLTPQIEDDLKKMINNIPDHKILELPITDLLVMVYGKVLERCTMYSDLKSRKQGSSLDFEGLITGARSSIMRFLITKITHMDINVISGRMAFYLLVKLFYSGAISGDAMIKVSQIFGLSKQNLESDGVIKSTGGVMRLYHLTERPMDYQVDEIDENNLHQQLCYLARTAVTGKSNKILEMLARDNFRTKALRKIVVLILNSFAIKQNKGKTLSAEESDEKKVLQTLSDIMGIKAKVGGLDEFV